MTRPFEANLHQLRGSAGDAEAGIPMPESGQVGAGSRRYTWPRGPDLGVGVKSAALPMRMRWISERYRFFSFSTAARVRNRSAFNRMKPVASVWS